MNQKVSTGLGVAIILVMAFTAGYFVWVIERAAPHITSNETIELSKIPQSPPPAPKTSFSQASCATEPTVEYAANMNDDGEAFGAGATVIVRSGTKEIARFQTTYDSAETFLHKGCSLYVGVSRLGLGGYILYGGPFNLYQVNLETSEVTHVVSAEHIFVTDVSADEQQFAVVGYSTSKRENGNFAPEIRVLDREGKTARIFPVPLEYGAAGEATFSQDGKKMVYAATTHDPDQGLEHGVLYIGDIETGEQKLFRRVNDVGMFSVESWAGNSESDIKFTEKNW